MTSLNQIIDQAGITIGRGRQARPTPFEVTRELTQEDILSLQNSRSQSSQPIQKIRQAHHTLAKLLAQGVAHVEISVITGYSPSRISVLSDDPTFKELVTYYSTIEKAAYDRHRADMHERLSALGFDSIEILHERLLGEEGETMPLAELAAIIKLTSDRTGYGPTSTQNVNTTHSLDEETLRRIRGGDSPPNAAELREADRGALLRLAHEQTQLRNCEEEGEPADWVEGEGDSLREEGDQGTEAPPSGDSELPSVAPLHGQQGDELL